MFYCRVHLVEKVCVEMLDLLDRLVLVAEKELEAEMELRVKRDTQDLRVKRVHR